MRALPEKKLVVMRKWSVMGILFLMGIWQPLVAGPADGGSPEPTPLQRAVMERDVDTVRKLLAAGADPNAHEGMPVPIVYLTIAWPYMEQFTEQMASGEMWENNQLSSSGDRLLERVFQQQEES